jgi:parallel beta-helix repeat protein
VNVEIFNSNFISRRAIMIKKLIYLASVLLLSLTVRGWSYASNPSPPDGAVHKDTWASLSWRPGEQADSFDIYIGNNYDDVKNGTGNTFLVNQRSTFFVVGFPGFPYPDGLVPGTTYYWRIDEIDDQHPDSPSVGDVWSFKIPSSKAYDPEPADGAVFVDPNVTLSWEPGYHARLHTVFFGDSFTEVSQASEGRPQGGTTYSPGILESGKTYYWRIDEFDGTRTHKGDVWSFTVGAAAPPGGEQGIIYVDAVHGNDRNNGLTPRTAFATIQRGIDVVADGVVVLVYPGLYLEEINFLGKALTVQGIAVNPDGVPVLWNPGDFAVSFYSGEGPGSVLKNFIIKDSFMGVFIADSSPTLSNLTIVGNTYGIEAYADSEPDISNTILWNNTDGDLFGCRARYSCIERGGEGNITDDPLFADPDNDDYHLRSERGRYWPRYDIWVLDKVTSPCVDAGAPDADILNEPMPNGGRINIGAYGGTTEASLSPSEQPSSLSYKASNPYPADKATDVEGDVTLAWTAGLNAVSHDVYFGTDIDVVFFADTSDAIGTYRGRQSVTSYTPPEGAHRYPSYYWRIDEIDSAGNITKGDVWTFRTTNPPPKGRTCFTAETKVWVSGALVPISKVALGQSICGINNPSKIQEVQEHSGTFTCYDVSLESGNCIGVAENHYFLSESGQWISLHDLKAGIKLKTSKGSIGIMSVTKRPTPYVGKVYNLKVEGSDRYLVGKDAVIVRDY